MVLAQFSFTLFDIGGGGGGGGRGMMPPKMSLTTVLKHFSVGTGNFVTFNVNLWRFKKLTLALPYQIVC